MGDETSLHQLGGNAREALATMARDISDLLNDIADLQERVKEKKAEAKNVGYDMKALGQIIRELRKGAKYQAAQLELELILGTYREAVDLPTDLRVAQERAAEEAESLPDDEPASDDRDEAGLEDVGQRRKGKGRGKARGKAAGRKDLN